MDNQNKNGQEAQQRHSSLFRIFIIFITALVAVLALFMLLRGGDVGEEVGWQTFQQELESDHIDRVEITNSRITYRTKDQKWYYFNNRESIEFDIVECLENYRSEIENYNNNPEYSGVEGFVEKAMPEVITGPNSTFNWLSLIYPICLVLVGIITIVLIVRMIRNVNSRNNDFVRNRARVAESKVRFDRVAGADEEKQELEEIIQFLRSPEKFTKVGARIPKGVLLVGPPGTGKTLLAKAVAGEANVPFFTISGSDFMELYVGVGASRVRDLFENAKRAKPCIVFIDEIDAVGRQRGTGLGGGNDEREQTLNQLLVQMDGFETNEGIIVMAATNRADILDPALMRPGRFDRQIYINIPDVKGREEILKVHAKNKPLASDVKLKEVARVTSGFTGADLENVLNEAAILAARRNRSTISMDDINNAIVKVSIGPQKRSRVVSEKDRRITAFHESGHAIVEKCVKNSNPVHEVSIIQRGGAAGYTISRPEDDNTHMTKQKLLDNIIMLLGGRGAEAVFLDDITAGASNDLQRATQLARRMVIEFGMSDGLGLISYSENDEVFLGRDYQTRATYSETEATKIDAEVKKIIDQCYKKTIEILESHKSEAQTMVEVLLEKETIYSDEVDMILNGATKEEVVKFIEERAKSRKADDERRKAEELEKQKREEESQKIATGEYIDNLILEAEKRKAARDAQPASPKPQEKQDVTHETQPESQEKAVEAPAEKETKQAEPKTTGGEEKKTRGRPKGSKNKAPAEPSGQKKAASEKKTGEKSAKENQNKNSRGTK